jgi:hypothetical protein
MTNRRRGATFTVIVLLSSMLLLSIGGAFVESSRNLVTLSGLRDRQEQCKEGLAGAAVWARSAVLSGAPPAKAKLELRRATVEVELRPVEDAYFFDAAARSGEVTQRARGSIAKRDGKWVVTRFELMDRAGTPVNETGEKPPGEKKPPEKAPGGEKKKFR